MLTFTDLKLDNWGTYRESIVIAEAAFPESIRFDESDYLEALAIPHSVARLAILDESCIGVAIGCPLTVQERMEDELEDMHDSSQTLYMYNILVSALHQGRGYGKELMLDFIEACQQRGYVTIVGHFRQNASLALLKKFGGQEKKLCLNWSDSGEDYVYCELGIQQLPVLTVQQQVGA